MRFEIFGERLRRDVGDGDGALPDVRGDFLGVKSESSRVRREVERAIGAQEWEAEFDEFGPLAGEFVVGRKELATQRHRSRTIRAHARRRRRILAPRKPQTPSRQHVIDHRQALRRHLARPADV